MLGEERKKTSHSRIGLRLNCRPFFSVDARCFNVNKTCLNMDGPVVIKCPCLNIPLEF